MRALLAGQVVASSDLMKAGVAQNQLPANNKWSLLALFCADILVVFTAIMDIALIVRNLQGNLMKKLTLVMLAATLNTAGLSAAQAQDELIYVAVEPCRIGDTRKSSLGVIRANTFRDFRIAGTSEDLAAQGGTVDCLNPREGERPVAIAAYVIAVPAESSVSKGVLTAYPSDQAPPAAGAGSTVNFARDQVIGNTTITTVCSGGECPPGGEFAVLARNTDEHVVIDVQGYFYPQKAAPGYVRVQAPFAVANRDSVTAEAVCPAGKKVLGGGGNVVDPTWFMGGSYPVPDGTAWRASFGSSGATFSVAGNVWAICATVD